MFGFVDEAQENVVDLFSYEGAEAQEFSVNTMKHSFQKVTFARIFRIEQFQQLKVEIKKEVNQCIVNPSTTQSIRIDFEKYVSKATKSISDWPEKPPMRNPPTKILK